MPNWPSGAETTVSVHFAASSAGSVVSIAHSGWESVGPDGVELGAGYGTGWAELLGFYRGAL
jgi:hypothetical protein